MRNWRWLLIAAAMSLASCGEATHQEVGTAKPDSSVVGIPVDSDAIGEGASCPVTQPPNPRFGPPAPYPTAPPPPYSGQFWYGTPALWTMLGPDGTWEGLPYQDGAYSQKVFWWRHNGNGDPPQPKLTVTGRRIDGPSLPLTASIANYGARDDIGSFMVVGIGIPAAGCWEITGHDEGTDLRFVVWVTA